MDKERKEGNDIEVVVGSVLYKKVVFWVSFRGCNLSLPINLETITFGDFKSSLNNGFVFIRAHLCDEMKHYHNTLLLLRYIMFLCIIEELLTMTDNKFVMLTLLINKLKSSNYYRCY